MSYIKNYLADYLITFLISDTPKRKLQFNAGFIPGQIADIRTDHITESGKVNLFQATVKLDEANFLKPDYNVNSKEIEGTLDKFNTEFTKFVEGVRKKGTDWAEIEAKERANLNEITKGLPNSKPIREYYSSEWTKVKEEFLEDKSLREVLDVLNKSFGVVLNSVIEIIEIFRETTSSILKTIQVTLTSILDTIHTHLIPPIKDIAEKLATIAAEISKSILEIFSGLLATMGKLIEKYQPQFKEIAAMFGELGQDIARFIQNAYSQTFEILARVFDKIYNELKAFPLFEGLKAQYDEVSLFYCFNY